MTQNADSDRLLNERRCRETGLMVELWHNLDGVPGYTIVCTEHAFISTFETRTDAEACLPHPRTEGWCEICSGADRLAQIDSSDTP